MSNETPSFDPIAAVRKNVSALFLSHTLDRLGKAYSLAYDEVTAGYQEEEAHDVLGVVVRAKFEGSWRSLGGIQAHREAGVEGEVKSNRRGTSNYTVMRCGMVSMTASAVSDPDTVVRFASFRNVFSEPQGHLFDKSPRRSTLTDMYAIVLHGRESRRNPGRLGFAHLVLPKLDCDLGQISGYYHDRIDLLQEFGSVVRATQGVPEERVLDTLRIELRKQKGVG